MDRNFVLRPQGGEREEADLDGFEVVSGAAWQRLQLPQRFIRLAQVQPIAGAPDPQGVVQRKGACALLRMPAGGRHTLPWTTPSEIRSG